MTRTETDSGAACSRLQQKIYHFQAGELPGDEQQELANHVEDCPRCKRRLEIEDAFLRGLKARIPRASAPPGLRYRVRAAIEDPSVRARRARGGRAAWLLPTAASVLLAALLLPSVTRWNGVVHVERDVTVVDLDCAQAGREIEYQRRCAHPLHRNALAVGPEEFWNIGLHDEAGRRLVADRDIRGHRVHVVGNLHTGTRTLEVAEFIDRDLEQALSALVAPVPIDLAARSVPAP